MWSFLFEFMPRYVGVAGTRCRAKAATS